MSTWLSRMSVCSLAREEDEGEDPALSWQPEGLVRLEGVVTLAWRLFRGIAGGETQGSAHVGVSSLNFRVPYSVEIEVQGGGRGGGDAVKVEFEVLVDEEEMKELAS